MINIDSLLEIINKEKHNPYKLQIKNNPRIYGYIKNIKINNNIITFNYIDYFTDFDSVYEVENNENSNYIIVEPNKMRGIFRGIITIDE
jgi:hypothetical protein